MPAQWKNLLQGVSRYYSDKIDAEGPSAKGADWNSSESQELRFKKLLSVCDLSVPFSLNDIGCGYGALASYLQRLGCACEYRGSEVSPKMLLAAKECLKDIPNVTLFDDTAKLTTADFTVASGILNVKLDTDPETWKKYTFEVIDQMNALSEMGFAFNILTSYSDVEKRAPHLFYANPTEYFDLCKTRYSKNVALLHDYDLYEFTILVRKT